MTSIVPAGSHTSHTTLECSDLQATKRFYRDVLGLRAIQHEPHAMLVIGENGHFAAVLQVRKLSSQPRSNHHARPVSTARDVDAAHDRIADIASEHAVRTIEPPRRETIGGVESYGFALEDRDGNWWRISENAGPFGALPIGPNYLIPGDGAMGDPAIGSVLPAGPISYAMLQSRDLKRARPFYAEFLGLPIEARGEGTLCSQTAYGANLVIVEESDVLPQPVLNHTGITVHGPPHLVDLVHAEAVAQQERFGILRVKAVTDVHATYSFYFQDMDTNWWEIEVLDLHEHPWHKVVRQALAVNGDTNACRVPYSNLQR
jgi:catechol 2,3-dioxygenase-like lactoylglutathione lyase family enzyme